MIRTPARIMPIKDKTIRFLSRDGVIGLLLLAIFLLTNGYIYGWDDQHLEIPLLKSIINPDLYPDDYYIQGLKGNFISYLYPLLARIISIKQIPAAFFFLFLVSRYVLFFFIYRLWRLISGRQLDAVLCTLMIMLLGRVDEFLYRTFSHQEFALAIIMIGIYYFYKERHILAAMILGAAANFHILYSLFPFVYLLTYVTLSRQKNPGKLTIKTLAGFVLCSAPVIVWVLQKKIISPPGPVIPTREWMSLYKIACPQNFLFYDNTLAEVIKNGPLLFERLLPYLFLLIFLGLNRWYNPSFREDRKTTYGLYAGFGLILISYVFTYIWPVRQILDLNLIRNSQYMLFFLMGYTALLTIRVVRKENMWLVMPFLSAFILIRFGHLIATCAGGLMIVLLTLRDRLAKGKRDPGFKPGLILLAAVGSVLMVGIVHEFQIKRFSQSAMLCLIITIILTWAGGIWYLTIDSAVWKNRLRKGLLLLPFLVLSLNYISYHRTHIRVEKEGMGFWQLQRNWLDMQNYVKNNLPENALFLVPHDMEMGGFRIFSERPIVVSYRDCGVIGFDYNAAVEWHQRLQDVGAFKVLVDQPVTTALKRAIEKYGVHYIIFMRYMDPGPNALLDAVYANETFVLYRVIPNPVLPPRP